jgi:glutamyl-tRNA reductase
VLNRTLERARALAGRWEASASTFERLPEALREADILIASTGAPHIILPARMVAENLAGRGDRPLVIIDIAVPRDVDPQVAGLRGVRLFDLDAIQESLARSLARRAQEAPRVEAILAEMQAEFEQYLDMLDVFPLIAEMHQRAEAIRQVELKKTLRRLPELNEAEREHLDILTQALVKKILHAPITRLKTSAGSAEALDYAVAARALFDLGTWS